VSLRRRAVFMLGRRGDSEAATLLGVTAKTDPSVSVRSDAITWLPKLQGDAGVAVLEDLLRTEQDENIQRSVVHTLVASDNAKARSSMRTLIERKDAALNLRIEAINSYNNDRTTADDAAFLRNFYSRADNDRLKEAVVGALGRIGGPENDAFVLNIIKNTNEPSSVRSQAISRMMGKNMSIADIGRLYDAADARNIRMQLVNLLDRRQEPEAADKLYDVAKNSTDQQVRTQAFNALLRRKDERTKQLLNDILDGKKPPT
jgi:HEAT repeat protein